MATYRKEHVDVLQGHSLRDIVTQVNHYNDHTPAPILKEDIVSLFHEEGTWFLIYYK